MYTLEQIKKGEKMCYKIEASFVLMNELKSKDSCTMKEIVHKKYEIEEALPSVFVDVSRNSILETIGSYPEIFEWNDNRIIKKDTAQKYFKKPIINFFTNDIDKEIRDKIFAYFDE